ncbi:hybrid sensor histidine kinase/response regulator [Pedosphaera parvula]|uniref:histidine kinase n=1 Tax=Pedosphaera parvula (strain Ellin514) TaxID=320771 RepID=B9XDM3_PEDPL|nr:response regulator [Pedosphaera parvula]EEF62169.1 CheA signal transduction histidine kinase [Pedosphaera parvula Ellin514]
MSTPLHDMPELRASFEADTGTLMELASEQLAALDRAEPNYSITPSLRNTIHSLRGAAAMVGAQPLSSILEDYERLLEVADSFKLTAREKAQQAYSFLRNKLQHLRTAIQETLAGHTEKARSCYEIMHGEVLATWGEYFYPSSREDNDSSLRGKHERKIIQKTPRNTPKATSSDKQPAESEDVARQFLSSLGVAGPAPKSAPKVAPEPAPAPKVAAPEPAPAPKVAASAPAPAVAPVKAEPVAPVEQVDPEMLSYFVLETTESLTEMEALLFEWEKTPSDPRIHQSVFRLAHTIKGAANSVGLVRIGQLFHDLEDLLDTRVAGRAFARLDELIQLIFDVSDTVKGLVREAQTGVADAVIATRVVELGRRFHEMANAPAASAKVEPANVAVVATPQTTPTITISTADRKDASLAVGGVETLRKDAGSRPELSAPVVTEAVKESAETKIEAADKTENQESQTIRVDSDRLDLLMNLIGELVISRSRLERKLADISQLKEEMFLGKTRLFHAITDFQTGYEYSQPGVERRSLAAGADNSSAAGFNENSGSNKGRVSSGPAGFSELEFDQYNDFNILARTLMEIGTDTGEIFSQLNGFFDAFGEETEQFSKITSRLQDEITRVRMMPLTVLFQRLKRSARDAARKERKEIDFVSIDNDARLDKLILDQLYTPLLHIVRNAVSHGLESKERREKAGKNVEGRISLQASCVANQVVIEVSDDGRGLDLAAIRTVAIQRGLLRADSEVNDEMLTQFIFESRFSTASSVTDVSGRGVGLDVVRQEISRLGGTIHVRSVIGEGCTFVIHLPLTLAINQAMFITAGTETCALPLNFVERVLDVGTRSVSMSGTQELVETQDGLVPLVRLHRLLKVSRNSHTDGALVLARVADRRVAIAVDRVLRRQDIVVKPLGPLLQGHPLFSGATLAGDGRVVMIVDLPRLLQAQQTFASQTTTSIEEKQPVFEAKPSTRPTILVVDDSLSVRKVIEKHLKALHFNVELAIDGLDALEKLRNVPVSLVLTDLEMPRMHGFELIAEIRRHESFHAVPVIVVTSRDAEKHRLHAASLGANDYIIKPFSREQLAERIDHYLSIEHS